ncbi:hypothetical protein [Leptolyngbya sp. FACHB-711]|uniref:hypothetical protein n=1 Tax=unclassified Leptolyngbya TaxID=2650499 RepID=UPI001681EC74|nr:hypothetical protein [Leptolyngbya sp. FACHB-711]MBD1853311.1 hypothetical protein [Cyanobacteria bacterium FACHB-502]MBD2024980.1 hypothetical protein [Leptolyngbya sp. FACHB-711]
MTQNSNIPGSWQSTSADLPEVHEILQQVAKAIYIEAKEAVPIDQQKIQVERAIALGFLKQQEDEVTFVESALKADYLVEYAVNELVAAWDNVDVFLKNISHLYRCSILLNYNLALGSRSICSLVHEHGKDLITRIIEVATLRSTEDISHDRFWHLYEIFCAALPDLRPEPKPLVDALEVIASINLGAGKIQYEIQGLLKQSQEIVEAFYQEFTSRSNRLFIEFIFTTLLILSQFDFYTAHQRALSLTGSCDSVEANLGIAVLGRLNYSAAGQSDLLAKTLDRFNEFLLQQNTELDLILTKAYGDLLDHSDEAIVKFVELSSRSDLTIRQEAAQVLFRRAEESFQKDWYKQALLAVLQKPLLHLEILKQLDFAIRHYVHNEPGFAIRVIEVFALNWDYTNNTDNTLSDITRYTLTELFNHYRNELNSALTQWFASRIPRLHHAASEIEHFFASIPSNNSSESADNNLKPSILLSKPVLDSLDELTVQQILSRIAGYVTGGISLAALILSAARREPISRSLAEQIVILLGDYVVYDYPVRAKEYLNNRLSEETTTEVERQIIQASLKRFDRYFQARQSLPPLKELQAPPSRIYAYYQAQWKQNADIVEQAKERSIFRTIFAGREIPIKYGKASAHFDEAAQKVSEPMRFAPLSYRYDVPQSDAIDPVGRAYQRWRWRLVGFEQATDTFETNSAEPEV